MWLMLRPGGWSQDGVQKQAVTYGVDGVVLLRLSKVERINLFRSHVLLSYDAGRYVGCLENPG